MLLRRDAKVELLKHVPLFAGCSKKELQRIAMLADEVDLPEGKVLTRQGAIGREFFVLVEGAAEVVRDGTSIDSLAGGDFFGEVALVSRRPRNATVTAKTPVRVLVITERGFRGLLDGSPQIQLKVLRALAERVAPGETA